MKLRQSIYVVLALMVVFAFSSTPVSASDSVLVPGNPQLKMSDAYAHLSLMEFVLETRLTTGQKNRFVELMRVEFPTMSAEDRNDFLQGKAFVETLKTMNDEQLILVRMSLQEDFERAVADMPEDPASMLYAEVNNMTLQPIAATENGVFYQQSFEAFIEWMGFSNSPDRPIVFNPEEIMAFRNFITNMFNKLSPENQRAMSEFENTWHLIKAGWMTGDPKQQQHWRTSMARLWQGVPKKKIPADVIHRVIQPALWDNLYKAAVAAGEKPRGFVTRPGLMVW